VVRQSSSASKFLIKKSDSLGDNHKQHARLDRGSVQLLTRTGLDWTYKYPSIASAVSLLIDPFHALSLCMVHFRETLHSTTELNP
jgi:hypothetical protein